MPASQEHMAANSPQSIESSHESGESFSEPCPSDTQAVIDEAQSLVDKLKSSDRICTASAENKPLADSNGVVPCSKAQLVKTLDDLNQMLGESRERVKRLKFKNMMLTESFKHSESRFEVETNLSKQQFERIRCQLVMETHDLHEKVRLQDLKLAKYRETIMEKNKEINRMARLLNDSSIPNSVQLRNTPQSIGKPSRIRRTSKLQRRNSNMLATLGLLATRVLGDGNETQINSDNTESDISHDSFQIHHQHHTKHPQQPQNSAIDHQQLRISSYPGSGTSSLTPTSDSFNKQAFQMTSVRRTNSVNGTSQEIP
ncbi:LADA_0F00914g1_1 [Lachancea dasiensis]|uniref:LADA_0F00914g1_1 n=1 Tax=Lachancea dasiensis TaxID=1072105 RepID=A0A1G4JHU0_9SACH|nr:LADA_0F00914g1_1 [Lachancea dasiensis]